MRNSKGWRESGGIAERRANSAMTSDKQRLTTATTMLANSGFFRDNAIEILDHPKKSVFTQFVRKSSAVSDLAI
jgi:hypothetical protein